MGSYIETRRYRKIADENKSLFQSAQSANRTKSQFLTMMSHELRTPMNGILGMLALAKQQGVSPQQERLLDQATDSSKKMNGLLSDILDFATLEDKDLKLNDELFKISDLAENIVTSLKPLMRHQGILFNVEIEKSCPRRLKGDMRRLRQSIVHLADYLAQTAATRAVNINMICAEHAFRVQLSYVYGESDTDWQPTLVLGVADRGDDTFASDALGPAVARGFVERMGGSIALYRPDPAKKHVAVQVSIPISLLYSGDLVVRLETRSSALAAICQSMMAAEHIQFYQEGYEGDVHAIVIEAGSEQEAQIVQELRGRHPNANLVALGMPAAQDHFDHIVALPIDVDALRKAVFQNGQNKFQPRRLRTKPLSDHPCASPKIE